MISTVDAGSDGVIPVSGAVDTASSLVRKRALGSSVASSLVRKGALCGSDVGGNCSGVGGNCSGVGGNCSEVAGN